MKLGPAATPMPNTIEIRTSAPRDQPAIETLYRDAFPDEDLLPVVRELLAAPQIVLSLVCTLGSTLAGHVIFTMCDVTGSTLKVALLAPLAVASAHQRKGIGSAMVRDGLERLQKKSVVQVYVLGDPAYYGRLGFHAENNVKPPYPLPGEWRRAWQSKSFGNAEAKCSGQLAVPPPWRQPALWAP